MKMAEHAERNKAPFWIGERNVQNKSPNSDNSRKTKCAQNDRDRLKRAEEGFKQYKRHKHPSKRT